MKLWHISQTANRNYDTYDSAVVAAQTEDDARAIHPSGNQSEWQDYICQTWTASLENVHVTLIGEAKEGTPAGVICASFNAG